MSLTTRPQWPPVADVFIGSHMVSKHFSNSDIQQKWCNYPKIGFYYRVMGPILILCMSSLSASIKRIGSKTTDKRWRHCFPDYKSMGAFCCHGNQCFVPICPKTLCSLSPTPVMLHIIFDQHWPTGFRDIQVWKCGRWTTTDGQRTSGIL